MESIKLPVKKKQIILALGAESAGVFAFYKKGDIFISENFGDLLDENNFLKYKNAIFAYLSKEKIKPDIVLTDLHPVYKTTIFGEELAEKYRVPHIKVQHHIAHIFSTVGDWLLLQPTTYPLRQSFSEASTLPSSFFGIAMDGTGYGLDGNIWGGEVFHIEIPNPKSSAFAKAIADKQIPNKSQNSNSKIQITRIGSLEEQTMIGGDLAVREPARMLIAILAQITNHNFQKEFTFYFIKKFYTQNEFKALHNQLEQNFNCQKTTSTGRILDAVSVLLGFANNERKYKHEAVKLLEENSATPYMNLEVRITNAKATDAKESRKILNTTYLFEYLVKNINRDKKRLAATAQLYLAQGLCEIIKQKHDSRFLIHNSCFAAGGMANNKIISSYLENRGVYLSKKIPRGDEGIAMGQIICYLMQINRRG